VFQGTIPQSVRAILYEAAAGWHVDKLAVACSGNFTIERLFANKFASITGCDVSIYTCALGAFFAGLPFRLELREAYHDQFGWLLPGMTDQTGATATLMLVTSMSDAFDSKNNLRNHAYYKRLVEGYRQQWPGLLEKTRTRLESVGLRLAAFHMGDAVDWLPTVPADTAVISFPPFFAGGYEKMWAKLDGLFDWDKPGYQELFEERRRIFIDAMTGRDHWAFITPEVQPEFEDHLRGIAQTTNRGVRLHVYTSKSATRVVGPHQQTAPVNIPRLAPGDQIGDALRIVDLTKHQFQALRSQYLNPAIKPALASAHYGVMVDDKLIGVFAFYKGYKVPSATPDTVYLLSDFAVAPTDYAKLSKLVLYAALSRESQLLAERLNRQRIRYVMTTAFTDNPVSMKYRGLFKLENRKETPDGEHRYALNYLANAGQWTLEQGMKEWKKRHQSTHALSESTREN
jgi:hypothetical protein